MRVRLKRKLSYIVALPGPLWVPIKKFRTKAKARRFARANGIKCFWIYRFKKPRKVKPPWILEKPTVVELKELIQSYVELHAKDLTDQLVKVRNELVLKTILMLDEESLKCLASSIATNHPANEPSPASHCAASADSTESASPPK